jgi:sugar phosphate isomerase/epimerase
MVEFAPPNAINTLASALEYIRHVGKSMCKLLIDAMHFFRSGATIAELKAVDPALIGYAQLCDVPLVSRIGDYMKEAMLDRLPPGEGELPLADLLAALPPGLDLGVEVPMLAQAEAGVEARVYIGRAVRAAQELVKNTCGN